MEEEEEEEMDNADELLFFFFGHVPAHSATERQRRRGRKDRDLPRAGKATERAAFPGPAGGGGGRGARVLVSGKLGLGAVLQSPAPLCFSQPRGGVAGARSPVEEASMHRGLEEILWFRLFSGARSIR